MPINKLHGLRGLKGLGSLNKAQYDDFIEKNRDLIAQHGNDPMYVNQLYSNKQFIDRYGIDKFKAIPDMDMRNEMYKSDVINTEFDYRYKPTKTNKGLGMDYNKYVMMSPDAKLKLMESNYLLPDELNKKVENEIAENNRRIAKGVEPSSSLGNFIKAFGSAFIRTPNETAMGQSLHTDEMAKQMSKELNQKIIDKIYNDDVDNYASKLGSEVSAAYNDPLISAMSDDQVKEAFVQAITPGSYKDKNGMPNMGIAEFASHYGKGSRSDISSEMANFSIDDMRQILAKKKAYDTYMSPEMAATALNNEAKRYIKDHQGSFKRLGLFLKDVSISSMSYTADKMNGIAELYRMGQDAFLDKPVVMVDDRGNVIDPNKTKVVRDRQGNMHYQDRDGRLHSVHNEQIDYTTLHNMGKNADGSDIKGAFGTDWMTLNPQYWNRAEQFGTLDENEQKQYEKLGSSPYKVAYNPNEDSDIWYEAFKMMSFGIADIGAQIIPYGIGTAGKALSTANKVGKIARGFGKVMDTTGKMLTAETKFGQVAQGTAGALGIAYAYNRGAFQETLAQNLANAEEAVTNASKTDIFNQYNNDKNYKAQVDKLIGAKAASMKAAYVAQMKRDGGMQIADEKALDEMLRAKAQDEVLGELVQNRVKERKSSEGYAKLQQEAINSAGDAAFNTFLPEAIKYGFVNTMGYRKFLYTNPAGLSRKVSSSLKGLKEITTKDGLKRMSTEASKFLTRGEKLKEFGKTFGSQAWGGAWTNGTDDMQVDAAERINEDSYNRYLQAYQNGEAMANTYGFADGLYSYLKGLSNSMGQNTTWNSAIVGGLGSIVNVTPNFINMARLATKEGREAYKNNFRREIERDENGMPLKNEDGSPKYKELGKWNNWRGQLNYFIQNGVLNTYYGKKQSERDLQSHADYVNNILDQYNDFKDIEKLIASNLASENISGTGDEKTLDFIKALHSINALNNLGNSSNDPTTMSSVVQNAKNLIANLSKLEGIDLDKGEEIPIDEEGIANLLSQYYAMNPGIEQNTYENRKALKTMIANARTLRKASEAFDKTEIQIQKVEKNKGITIDPTVRTELKIQQALNDHWTERLQKLKSEINDYSSEEKPQDTATVLATVGGKRNAQSLIKVYDRQKTEVEKELSKQEHETDTLVIQEKDAYNTLKEAKKQGYSDEILKAENGLKEVQAKLQSARQQEKYLRDIIVSTENKKKALQSSIDSVQSDKNSSDKVLTADEIFSLDPVTRARMMNQNSREFYSEEQQHEIEKLEKNLLMKDADALQKVQDISLLTQRLENNKDAYTRMAENPEAAAYALENQRMQTAETAYDLVNQNNAETFADVIMQFDESAKEHPDIKDDFKEQFVFKELRKLNSSILDILDNDNLLPQYQDQINKAKEWVKTVEDIAAIVSKNNEKDSDGKNKILEHINEIVEASNNKEEIMKNLEKAIDDNTDNADVVSDLEYVLNGMEQLGYQRDATVVEDRKTRKQREEEKRKKKEEEKKKLEEEAKKAAEKKTKEQKERIPTSEDKEGNIEDVDLGLDEDTETAKEESASQPAKTKPLKEKKEEVDVNKKNIANDVSTEHVDFDIVRMIPANKYESLPETAKYEENADFEAHSAEKVDGNWYLIGNFVGSKEQTKVKAKKSIIDSITGQQAEDAVAQGNGVHNNVEIIGDTAYGKSPSLEEQAAEAISEGKEVTVSEATENVDNVNKVGEDKVNTEETTLSGNTMSMYQPTPLKTKGIVINKVGDKPNDTRTNYNGWMKDVNFNIQNIVDHELARIIKKNPHAKVKFMMVIPAHNATEDVRMQKNLMLVLDYDNKVNKGITLIHDDSNGGVIESLGKKYLIIGVAGFGNHNLGKRVLYDRLWNSGVDGFRLKNKRKEFFDKHPNERFYVNEELSTEIVPYSQIPGYIVKQTLDDKKPGVRSVKELLADKKRNPLGYTMDNVAWGIQEASKFLIVGTSTDNVMIPRNPWGNLGSAFVLMPASNGKMVPSYLRVLKYTEMREGTLQDKIMSLLQTSVSRNYDVSINAIIGLHNILYLDKEGDNILRRKTRNEISLVHNGEIYKTFSLDDNFSMPDFLKAFGEVNPRVNITARVLSSPSLLEEYDEAGALMTDAALFGTAGSSFSVYGLNPDGSMIAPEAPTNELAKTASQSDFKNDKRQVLYNHQYYVEDNGVYSLDGETITDEKLIKQLDYNAMIRDGKLTPAISKKIYDTYILNGGENPQVIRVNRNTKEVKELSKKQAKEIVDEVNEQKAKEQREKAAEKTITSEDKIEVNEDSLQSADLDNSEFTVDPSTGEVIQSKESKAEDVTDDSTKGTEETKESKTPDNTVSDETLESPDIAEHKMPTQKFIDLVKDMNYLMRIKKILNNKWENAPKKISELEKFLRERNIEVDTIGTTKEDIEAWIKTMEDCR